MKVNILTEQANGLERKFSMELHQRIYRTHFKKHENTLKKTKEVAVHPNNKTTAAIICADNINSVALRCLRGTESSTNSLKLQRQLIDSYNQMKKICEQFRGSM